MKELTLLTLKENVRNLAEAIYSLCHNLRKKFQDEVTLDYDEELINLYYDLAEAQYTFFSNSKLTGLNLGCVQECLDKAIVIKSI